MKFQTFRDPSGVRKLSPNVAILLGFAGAALAHEVGLRSVEGMLVVWFVVGALAFSLRIPEGDSGDGRTAVAFYASLIVLAGIVVAHWPLG